MNGDSLPSLDAVLDVPISISAQLGDTRRTLKDILSLKPGTVLLLEADANDLVGLYVGRRIIARGEVVVDAKNIGVQITELVR